MRILKRALQGVLLILTLLIGASAAGVIVSQTAWGRDRLRGFIVRQGNQYLNGQLTVGRLDGNLFFGVELGDVRLSRHGGPVIAIRRASVHYDVFRLLAGNYVLTSVSLDHPVVAIDREDGRWNIADLLRPRGPTDRKSTPSLAIEDLQVTDGEVRVGAQPFGANGHAAPLVVPQRIDRLNVRLSLDHGPTRTTVGISRLSLRGQSPDVQIDQLSGQVVMRGGDLFLERVALQGLDSVLTVSGAVHRDGGPLSLDLRVTSTRLDLAGIGRVVPAVARFALRPDLDVSVKGPLDALGVGFDVRSGASGLVGGQVVVNATAPDHHVAGTIRLRRFDASPFWDNASRHTDVTGVAQVDVGFVSARGGTDVHGTYRVQAEHAAAFGYEASGAVVSGRIDGPRLALDARATAYGGRATAAGTIRLAERATAMEYDLHGHVAGLDLRRLPASLDLPRADSRLALDYRVTGAGAGVTGRADFGRSILAGATLAPGTKATFTFHNGQFGYTADGSVQGLDLQHVGRAFDIAALATDRYRSQIAGSFSASGAGTRPSSMRLDAHGTLDGSTFMGATLSHVAFTAQLMNGTLRATLDGQFAQLDPAVATGYPSLQGAVAGRMNVAVGLANIGATVSARSLLDVLSIEGTVGLGPSTFGGLRVDTGAVDGRYANRSADIRRLAIAGPDLRVDASGFIALGSQGQSSLTYELAAPSLDRLGRLFGQTLAGSLTAAGRVTGNGDNLRTTGTLKGLTLGYAGAQALAAVSQYDAELPGLDPAKAIVRATTSATFVQVAGQQIDDVTATTTYASRALDVDATLRQPGRQMRAAGNLVLHPDHQDVQLRRLGLQSQGVAWEMAPGTQAAIRYTGGTIDVGDIRLVNGTQQISVEGRIAPEASRLQVRLSAVDLAGVGALVIGDRGFAGQLDAEATITGPRDALAVASRVTIAGGAFRQFTYQSLTGTVNYARDRVELDVRLDERPGAWIVATGSLPLAFLRAPMPPAAASLPVSLRIQSSPLDLGIVQGFTSAVQKVTGTLSLEAQLAGTAGKPTLTGHVDVANGSFTVPATGVAYRGLDGRLLLQSDRVTVERLSVTDEHGASLNVAGDLAVQERELGALNLRVRGRSFEVVHNTFGRLQLNPDLTVGGQIRQPHVTGTLAVDTGSVNLDPLLEMAASSAYATSPAQLPSGGGAPPANRPAGQPVGEPASVAQASASATPDTSAAPAAPSRTASPGVASSPFDAASLDLHITVPDDLVIKGTDIRLGQESLGLGNLNLTIGGDVRVEKASGRPVRLLGQVQTIRGTYDFQGRRFDVQRGGTVRFEGGRDIDPSLDITGTQLISGVEARVRVSGTARKPALTFASNPPLEQADVLSLIMFGQPANQLGAGQQVSLAQRAGALATGFVAARLTQSIGSALNLDTFEIQAGSAVTGQTGATVTLGQQVGQRLYVKVRQGVGGEGGTLFILEYQLTNFLRFQSTMSQGGTAARNLMRRLERSGADLILAFSF